MKHFLLLMVLFVYFNLSAQTPLTLTQSLMPFGPKSNTVNTANLTGFTLPSIGINQTWDYSGLTSTGTTTLNYISPTSSFFPTATYADTGLSMTVIPGRYYLYDIYYQSKAEGVVALGTETKYQSYSITAVTGGANDVCVFPAQQELYLGKLSVLTYPTTMNSVWNSDFTHSVNFNLTIAAYMLNNVPCLKKSTFNRIDSVISWGKMRVPTSKGASEYYEVLMVKRMTVQSDSFFMNGSPAPGALLTTFGLSQGMKTLNNRYLFWRPWYSYPLLVVNFAADNFTTPAGVFYDQEVYPAGIGEGQNAEIQIYPNPITDNFNVIGASGYDLKVNDISGKVIFSSNQISSNFNVNSESFGEGVYFVRLTSGNNTLVRKICVTK